MQHRTLVGGGFGLLVAWAGLLCGDAAKAREKLGWRAKVSFQELVSEMVQCDLELAKRDVLVRDSGFRTPLHHE